MVPGNALTTNLQFVHRCQIMPGGGVGYHFHNQWEEMFVIDGEAEFTIDGYHRQQRIHKIDPVAGYHAEAELAAMPKETGKLEDPYQKAVDANPPSYAAQFRLASFYSGRGKTKYDQVEKHARAALALRSG